MKINEEKHSLKRMSLLQLMLWSVAVLCAALALQGRALAQVTLTLVDGTGTAISAPFPFRWQLEEDNTDLTVPGVHANDTASLVIHKSHAPVMANREVTATSTDPFKIPTDTSKRYVLSILKDGYSVGGNTIAVGQTTVGVVLNKHPIPTAQISVLVFKDHNPINNVPDATEVGLPGFHVILADFLGGPMMTDVFGNPLGTTYQYDTAGEPVLALDGSPTVLAMGTGFIYTDANGKALIKNLAMGKYGVQVITPVGSAWQGGHATANVSGQWHQTATIEGTLTVDAWVGANEPMIFVEGFGPGTYHTFFGFVDPGQLPSGTPSANDARTRIGQETETGHVTVSGVNRFNHFGRPPNNQQLAVGPPVSDAWVGLNELNNGVAGRGLYVAPCDPATGEFTINNVPPGTYQLVTWDTPLDALFGINAITVPAPATGAGTLALGTVFSFRWFGTLEGSFFYDTDGDGFRDVTETTGIPQLAINIRWRDGTIYQTAVTGPSGDYAFSEVFPFFKWMMLDSDYSRMKPTGLTAVVDEGGAIPADNGWTMPSEGVRNPQPQFETDRVTGLQTAIAAINTHTGNNLSRTEPGPVLTEAMHLFLNQNNRVDWGRQNYGPGENGGISGVICYQTTRAEEDPVNGTNDPWEPGIPRVQVALYLYSGVPLPADTLNAAPTTDQATLKVIKDNNANGTLELADVDNHPLGWAPDPAKFGAGDVDENLNGIWEPLLGDVDNAPYGWGTHATLKGAEDVDNNVNGLFDQGDAIQVVWTDSWDDNAPTGSQQPNPPVILSKPIIGSDNYATWNQIRPGVFDGGYAFGDIPAGEYIVQASTPPGYKIQTEESVNVYFGDTYVPSKLGQVPPLVGDYHLVPLVLTLFPDQVIPAPFTGKWRPLADRKFVRLSDAQNAACDFQMYTEVPKATRVVGFVLNDLTAEFNAASPIFGEKGSPGWIPISIRDWAGHEVAHVYCDEYGTYNALVPSTYNAAVPMPSGVAPNMLTLVLNDTTRPVASDPTGNTREPDPFHNPNFATTPWTLHYYPGTLLYADTPIVPTAALVGYPNTQLDVEPADGTPVIKSVQGNATLNHFGPYVSSATETITITSIGSKVVPNPAYTLGGDNGSIPIAISRNYGFGDTEGTVYLNGVAVNPLQVSWTDATITLNVVGTSLASGGSAQLTVANATGVSPIGVTLTHGGSGTVRAVTKVTPTPSGAYASVQAAIDAAANGDIILVDVGEWAENPILYKALRLQGSGAGTVINANAHPFSKLADWHAKVKALLGGDPFTANEAPGVMVLGEVNTAAAGDPVKLVPVGFAGTASRIDGFEIKGSIAGGGISVFNKANNLRISNNRVIANQGSFVGGIAIGMRATTGILYDNPGITIEYNQILKNGGVNGPGGIGLFTGAARYKIQNNQILGNFSRGSGGGIGHQGISPNGLIANNNISFNEVFYGAANVPAGAGQANVAPIPGGEGGGIFISGELAIGGLSSGAGSVTILNNLIQGNLAGAGDGGAIRVLGANGTEQNAALSANDASSWYAIDIINNIIVNNVSALAGGGISLADATRVRIINNTIANNDSSATALAAFGVGATASTPQIAGIALHQHNSDLALASSQDYANPLLQNNIIYQNRSFGYDRLRVPAGLFARPAPAGQYWDLGVVELPAEALTTDHCLLTGSNPLFAEPYVNNLLTAVVIDEAGNNVNVRFTPAGPSGDYHLGSATSPAVNTGVAVTDPSVAYDFDRELRPAAGTATDIGADEFGSAGTSVTFAITAPNVGPAIVPGGLPPNNAPGGAGTPPGPMMAPIFEPMPADADGLDTDGDGIPNNDNKYVHVTAGDGFVMMADGTELYSFGFNDVTALVNAKVAEAQALAAVNLPPAVVLEARAAASNALAMTFTGPTPDNWEDLRDAALAEAAALNAQASVLRAGVDNVYREIKPMVLSEGMLKGNFAAPTQVFKEGQKVYLDLSNVGMLMRPDLFDPHTVHFHGFPQAASIFDGEPMASVSINMGGTLRYFYNIVEPGTYLYHCHVEATEHMEMGMIGNLWVEPKQNNAATGAYPGHTKGVTKFAYNDGNGSTLYHVEAPIQLLAMDRNFHEQHIAVQPLPFWSLDESYPMINGRGYPDTISLVPPAVPPSLLDFDPAFPSPQRTSSLVTAKVGQRILLRMSNVSVSDFHTLTVLGIPMRIVGKDARLLRGPAPANLDLSYQTTSVTLGGGETADAILTTTGLAPGRYFIYDARLNHLNNDQEEYGGMMTEIELTP